MIIGKVKKQTAKLLWQMYHNTS